MENVCFSIRDAKPDDCPILMKMITELTVFEGTEKELENTTERLQKDIFEPEKMASCLVATYKRPENDKSEVIGYCLFYYGYSIMKGKLVYMVNLYITEEFRGRGYGRSLMKKVAQDAVGKGCQRMQWTVLGWNQPAIKLYQSINSIDLTATRNCHVHTLYKEQLVQFANS
ncbi:diamine acetyltransferase 2-like [Anneissia japonica]|uniref:diamine acetyltransferase 2-like n=1 Tax=Anneissia japonica TaxID=1529436 RepID=UPI0014257C54|nr:diamine acetyltransferase 2-like [Anneissia japonica]